MADLAIGEYFRDLRQATRTSQVITSHEQNEGLHLILTSWGERLGFPEVVVDAGNPEPTETDYDPAGH